MARGLAVRCSADSSRLTFVTIRRVIVHNLFSCFNELLKSGAKVRKIFQKHEYSEKKSVFTQSAKRIASSSFLDEPLLDQEGEEGLGMEVQLRVGEAVFHLEVVAFLQQAVHHVLVDEFHDARARVEDVATVVIG